MTPQEKAEKLTDKYWSFNEGGGRAKSYAIIAVDEILEVLKGLDVPKSKIQYWETVKEEIEKP